MSANMIRDLFATDIERNIEEVIKVDQTDEQIVREEIAEYVATDSIRAHFRTILERYAETPNKPHEGIGVWVSGFFGSGKSSFAKYLGLALENRMLAGDGAADLLAARIGDNAITVLLKSDQRAHPDPRGDLRCLGRPRHSKRQPDHHRDHVQAVPAEPWLRPRPRPLGARNHT